MALDTSAFEKTRKRRSNLNTSAFERVQQRQQIGQTRIPTEEQVRRAETTRQQTLTPEARQKLAGDQVTQQAQRTREQLGELVSQVRRQSLVPEERDRLVKQQIQPVVRKVQQQAQRQGIEVDEQRAEDIALSSIDVNRLVERAQEERPEEPRILGGERLEARDPSTFDRVTEAVGDFLFGEQIRTETLDEERPIEQGLGGPKFLLEEVGQSVARNLLFGGQLVATGRGEVRPRGELASRITGIGPEETFGFEREGQDILSIFGVEDAPTGLAVGVGMASITADFADVLTLGGKKKLGLEAAEQLFDAAKRGDEAIDSTLRNTFQQSLEQAPRQTEKVIENLKPVIRDAASAKDIQRSLDAFQNTGSIAKKAQASDTVDEFSQKLTKTEASTLDETLNIPRENFFNASKQLEEAKRIDSQLDEAVQGGPTARRLLGEEQPAQVTRTEPQALRDRIQQLSRGAREGARVTRKQIADLQTEAINTIEQGLPVAARGKLLRQVRNANSPRKLDDLLSRVQTQVEDFRSAQNLAREAATKRQKIGAIRRFGEFNQTAVNDVKRTVGVDVPLSKATSEQLDSVLNNLKERFSFKLQRGFKPNIKGKNSSQPEFDEDFYQQAVDLGTQRKSVGKTIRELREDVGRGADIIGGSISTRLENISPDLKSRLRVFERDSRMVTRKGQEVAKPFLTKLKELDESSFRRFDLAAKNGDAKEISRIAKENGMEKELQAVRGELDSMYKRAQEVGFDIGFRENYFPRLISDPDGFLEHMSRRDDWSQIQEGIKRKELALGRVLSREEKSQLINTMMRGYQGGQITLAKTGQMQERIIDFIDPELNQFYATVDDSIRHYLTRVNEAIEARRFFGKQYKDAPTEALNNLDDSIGAFTTDLIADGTITPKQENELSSILKARFGQKGTNGVVGVFKNLAYIDTLGSIENAITQLGDLGISFYASGRQSIPAGVQALIGKSKITKEELGFATDEISAEMSRTGASAKALDWVFRVTGFNKIDRLGVETLANGVVRKAQADAANPSRRFITELENMFPERAFGPNASQQVLEELRSGEITGNVKMYAFNKVLDFQPRALSEMPEKYLTAGNARILYMLKSWTLKLFDIYRREVFQEIPNNKPRALRNFMRLSASVMLANATADQIKDWMMGRETPWEDRLVDNMAQLAGFSRYTLFQAEREGLGSAVFQQIVPPSPTIDDVTKDAFEFFKDPDKMFDAAEWRTIRDIPLGVGDLYYWWFGKGVSTKEFLRQQRGETQGPNIEVPEVEVPEVEIPTVSI